MGDFDTQLTAIHSRSTSAEPITSGYCGACESPIGFYPPAVNSEVSAWYCHRCNAIYYVKADPAHDTNYFGIAPLPPFASVVATAASWLSEIEDGAPPVNLVRLVKLLCNQDYRGIERRHHERHTAVVAVIAVPLNEQFRVAGLPLRMTTTNASHGGVSLINGDDHFSAYYALDFSASGMALRQAVVAPVRMRALGPVYEIGARFVRDVIRQAD
jgi:hypothetical protein